MANEIKVCNKEIRIIEWNGERVVSTKDIAELHGLDVSIINRKYRRNKRYFMEGIDYFEVRRDQLTSANNGTSHTNGRSQEAIAEMLFRNPAEYILLITESGYLNFVKTINDDISWEIFKSLKEIYFKARRGEFKELRGKTKEVRNAFTKMLQDRGYEKKHHFIQTTMQMKKELGITAKKADMTDRDLRRVMVAEIMSDLRLEDSTAEGYYEVNPVCVEASKDTKSLIDGTVKERLAGAYD